MNQAPLPVEIRADKIAVLSLIPNPSKPRGGVVVLDRWLIDSLDASLCKLAEQDLCGLILQSTSERVFVAGADLAEIDALNDADLNLYLRAGSVAYGRITKLPFTRVAIIHKAALGGGLELAMHCDALIGAIPAPGEKKLESWTSRMWSRNLSWLGRHHNACCAYGYFQSHYGHLRWSAF